MFQIDVDDLAEVLRAHLDHRDALDDTCVVHEDVNLTHLLVDLLHESLHSVLVRHVTDIALHVLDAGLLIVGQTASEELLINVVKDDCLDACSHESLGDVETDTIGCASDPGVLSFQ